MPKFDTLGAFSMAMTASQLEKTKKEFSKHAKEPVTIEVDGRFVNVFGSELAVLRIFYKYRYTEGARVEYSHHLKTWFFSMQLYK